MEKKEYQIDAKGKRLGRLATEVASILIGKNRVDFVAPVNRTQASWFSAKTGGGSVNVNPFPTAAANGFSVGNRHPFLEVGGGTPPAPPQLGDSTTFPNGDGYGAYRRGMLVCWVVDVDVQQQVKWNHLSGTATIYTDTASYEYNAYSFFVPAGVDLDPVGLAGTINLNGLEYDSCPLYQLGQLTPVDAVGRATGQPSPPRRSCRSPPRRRSLWPGTASRWRAAISR